MQTKIIKFERMQIINKIPQILLIFVIVYGGACRFTDSFSSDTSSKLIVVKSPVSGIISKVLVREGATLEKDAGIVEIEVKTDSKTSPITDTANKPVRTDLSSNEEKIKDVEENVKRTSIEVERVLSLVNSNSSPQSQLDAARADFQQAQETLQNLKEKQKSLKTKKLTSLSKATDGSQLQTISNKKFIIVKAPKSGVMKVLNANVGQKVLPEQIIATISQD